MPTYRVTVYAEVDIEYVVKADSEEEAKSEAVDRFDDGRNWGGANVQWREATLVTDETAEHE